MPVWVRTRIAGSSPFPSPGSAFSSASRALFGMSAGGSTRSLLNFSQNVGGARPAALAIARAPGGGAGGGGGGGGQRRPRGEGGAGKKGKGGGRAAPRGVFAPPAGGTGGPNPAEPLLVAGRVLDDVHGTVSRAAVLGPR